MNDEPTTTGRSLLEVAALAVAGEIAATPDWLDDRDIAVMALVSIAQGLAELIESRDDFGDGFTSGRYVLAVSRDGMTLLEQPSTV